MAILLPVETTAPEFVPAPITDDEAAAMFRAALNLFRLWGLTDEQAATLARPAAAHLSGAGRPASSAASIATARRGSPI